MVIDNADKNNVTLTLTPNLIGEMKAKGFETAEKLRSFYTKFGFVKDKGKATMTRESNVSEVKLEAQPTNLLEGTEMPISKSQIVGGKAILSATADFNKNLAITMSESKSSPLDIRIATNWEKGADGEWRYEIPDGKYKDIDVDDLQKEMDYDGKIVRIAKLSDVFDAPDLYQAYPEAKNIKVGFKDLTAKKGYKLYGSYVKALNRINVNENLYKENRYEAELTMLHEIQHYIQGKEFFETGSSDSKSIDAIKNAENDFKNKLDTQKRYIKI